MKIKRLFLQQNNNGIDIAKPLPFAISWTHSPVTEKLLNTIVRDVGFDYTSKSRFEPPTNNLGGDCSKFYPSVF